MRDEGQLSHDQAMVVVQLAKTSNLLFGGDGEFSYRAGVLGRWPARPERACRALMRCLFRGLGYRHQAISMAEESEFHRIANELRIDRPDLVALRVAHQRHLPGLSGS